MMKKKRFTRKPTYLFTDLRKQPCPPGHFQHEDDLYHAYVDWLDYYDPIGFVCNWGIRREYEPEADELAVRVRRCRTAEEFTVELHKSLNKWFYKDDFKRHFLRRGFRILAEDGWALSRRFQFDMQRNPDWVTSQEKLARFKSPVVTDDDLLCRHQLLRADGLDCQYQNWRHRDNTLDFFAADVASLTDAQLIDKARTTGVVANDAEIRVLRDEPAFVTIAFDYARYPHQLGRYFPGPYPRRKKHIRTIEVD